jgi:hypothetical protein
MKNMALETSLHNRFIAEVNIPEGLKRIHK